MHDIQGRPTVAEVSLGALRTNLRAARDLVGPAVKVLAVVKADGYGHGAVAAARAFAEAGAAALGVSTVEEGAELRRAGVRGPVVVLGGAFPGEEGAVVAGDLEVAVWTRAAAEALAAAARAAGGTVGIHIKVETGMTRLGLDPADVAGFGAAIRGLAGLRMAGVFSHFASADAVDTASARAQIERFRAAVEALAAAGVRPAEVHLANSAATLSAPAAHFTMVRPGIMLYGYAPARHLASRARLEGTPVGYAGTWVATRPSTIAVLPLGYADGYHRLASNRAQVLVRGRRAPIAGRVCMDQTMVDVTDVGDVQAGEPVVLFGSQDGAAIAADEVGGWVDTIAYEVLTSVGKRVPRVYVEEFDG
ncbi:MAG: alanine racemase [Deltaproteobacteria bacterium]|nr:MAG: alanine racemase [Deltaproteobacteria bacterium]